MSNPQQAELPRTVNPYRLAEQNSTLKGEIPLSGLARFVELIREIGEDAVCRVSLSFYKDGERRRIVSGELEAPVILECQRCMGAMRTALESRFTLGLVTSDVQAQQLPRDLEPLMTDEFSVDLWSMIEDELLLVLPPFPLHERNECPAKEDLEAWEEGGSRAGPVTLEKDNPFDVLAGLGKTKH
jgi:uncharacterized protein